MIRLNWAVCGKISEYVTLTSGIRLLQSYLLITGQPQRVLIFSSLQTNFLNLYITKTVLLAFSRKINTEEGSRECFFVKGSHFII